jgi:PAS domain S-box-containing protein
VGGDATSLTRRLPPFVAGYLSPRYCKQLLLFSIGYWISGLVGLEIGSGYGISPLWPPAGLALFAMLMAGSRMWPGIFCGSLLLSYTQGLPWTPMLIIAGGHAIVAVVGAYLLRSPFTNFRPGMQRIRDVLMLTGFGAVGAALVGSAAGTWALTSSGLAPSAVGPMLWFTWWLGDAVGIIVVTPLLLTWQRLPQVRPQLRQIAELVVLLALLGISAWINFYLMTEHELQIPLVLYLMLPFAIWAAARFRHYGASLVAAIVCIIMISGTQHGYGAFAPYTDLDRLLLSIAYVAVTSFTALCVAALFAERVQTEKALYASREQFRTLIGTMNQGLSVQDKEGIVTYVNDRFCEMVGDAREEIVGKPVTAYVREIDRTLWLKLVNAVSQGRADPYELELKRKDGRSVYLQVSPQLMFDEDGQPVGSFAVYTDITRRKRIETTLSGRREVLERLATGAPLEEVLLALAVTAEEARPDMRCSVMMVEKGRLLVAAAPSLPNYYIDALHDTAVGEDSGSWAITAHTGRRMIVDDVLTHPYWYAYRRLARRAEVRSCWCEPIISSGGEILGTFAMYYRKPRKPEQPDLQFMAATAHLAAVSIEQKRKEEAHRQSEERFRQLAEHIRDVFWMADADGTPRYVSPAYERVWGRPLKSLHEDRYSWIDSIHPDDRNLIGRGIFIRVPKEDSEVEYRVLHPDGTIRWIRDRAFAIRNEAGEVYRVAGIAEDVTENKLSAQREREHQNELAHMARLNSVGEMASSLAHELNQPLGAVANYCRAGLRILRSDTPDTDKVNQALEKASVQAQRAGEIIHHIRDFVRKDKRRNACIDLNDVVREAVRLTEADIRKRRGTIRLHLVEHLPKVMGDRVQLEQVILNLLRNGMEAMIDSDALQRELVVYSRLRDQRMVQISVRDNGAGLDESSLEQIFNPFYTTKYDGMGMGLPISRSIIEAHAGHLWAETLPPPRQGAVFHFTLPVSQECAA